jgi:hypothetical protein
MTRRREGGKGRRKKRLELEEEGDLTNTESPLGFS